MKSSVSEPGLHRMFRTPAHCFSPTFQTLKTWLELSRVKLYRNDLRGNKNYFELIIIDTYIARYPLIAQSAVPIIW